MLDAKTFEVKGRWKNGGAEPDLNYDFWYQPRKNVLVSSEFGEPNSYEPGFDPADVAGHYGHRLHFWDLETRRFSRRSISGTRASYPSRSASCTTRTPTPVSWRRALEFDLALRAARDGQWKAEPVIDVEAVRTRAGRSRCPA